MHCRLDELLLEIPEFLGQRYMIDVGIHQARGARSDE